MLLGSTIIGLEHHTPEKSTEEIEHAVAHETDLHQFMLYTPVPGHAAVLGRWRKQGRLLDVDLADIHGQHAFNFQHAAISREESQPIAGRGRSSAISSATVRACSASAAPRSPAGSGIRTIPDPRVRARYPSRVAECCGTRYPASLWAMEHRLRNRTRMWPGGCAILRKEIEDEFGAWRRGSPPQTLGPLPMVDQHGAKTGGWREATATIPATIIERRLDGIVGPPPTGTDTACIDGVHVGVPPKPSFQTLECLSTAAEN